MRKIPAAMGTFLGDLRWALTSWRGAMGFVAFVFLLDCVYAVAVTFKALTVLILAIGLFDVGFVLVQRVWYLRRLDNKTLERSEIWGMTRAFFGRGFRLCLLCAIPILLLFIGWAISDAVSHPYRNGQPLRPIPTSLSVFAIVVTLAIDFALTFVVPTLAFQTDSAKNAVRSGLRMLRNTWPNSLWYALAPGLAISFSSLLVSTHALGGWGRPILWGICGMVAFAVRGAVVPFYLRHHSEVGPDGAAFVNTRSRSDKLLPKL
jgi:hypothetical protein